MQLQTSPDEAFWPSEAVPPQTSSTFQTRQELAAPTFLFTWTRQFEHVTQQTVFEVLLQSLIWTCTKCQNIS